MSIPCAVPVIWSQDLTISPRFVLFVAQFSEGKVAPPGARIVYIDGAFDLFHPGHVDILEVPSRSQQRTPS